MQNFSFEHNGQTLWFSRSLACAMLCYAFDRNGNLNVLVNQRGLKNDVYPGKWNVPGGFIDFNETAEECAIRETYEETGVELLKEDVDFFNLNTNPGNGRQTMMARFVCLIDGNCHSISTTTTNSEPFEVAQVKWVICDIPHLMCYEWTKDQIEYILKGKRFLIKKHFFKYFYLKLKANLTF